MDKLKQWIALTAVGVLVIAAGGWFLLISPKRSEAADIRTQADSQLSANAALSSKITMLKAQAKDLPQQQAKLAAVAAKIPDNPALPTLIRALTDAADNSGVELVSLSPSPPTAVGAAGSTAPVSAAPAAGTTAAAPAAATTSAGLLQSIALNVNVVGSYFQVEQFFDKVETLTRAMKVTGFTLAPGSNPVKPTVASSADPGKVLQATITANVYMTTGRTTTAAVAGK